MDVSEVGRYERIYGPDLSALGLFQIIKRYGAFIYSSHYLLDRPQLFLQECSTGKRLAPITCETDFTIEVVRARSSGDVALLDSAISEDETRVALVYGVIGACSFFTCVWHLNKAVSFDSDPFETRWGEVIFQTKTFQPVFDGSAKLALFAANDLLWCPAGLLNMKTGSVTPYAIHIPDVASEEDEACPRAEGARNSHSLTLYSKGDAFLFSRGGKNRYPKFKTQRFSSSGEKIEDVLPLADGRNEKTRHERTIYCNLLGTDESGRFIIWRKSSG
jgi:hypothetical protein